MQTVKKIHHFRYEDYVHQTDWKKFFGMVGHKIEDMLKYCTFSGKPCYASDFQRVLTDKGLCYIYNKNVTKITRTAGPAGIKSFHK